MRIAFELTAEDLDAFHADYYRSSAEGRRTARLGRWAVPGVVAVLLAVQVARSGYDPVWVPALLGWAASWALVFPWLLRWRTGRANRAFLASEAGAHALGPRVLELGDGGVRGTHGAAASVVGWAGFHRAVRGEQHLFLYLDGRQALILPRRAFASESEFEETADSCARRVAEARGLAVGTK